MPGTMPGMGFISEQIKKSPCLLGAQIEGGGVMRGVC